jgi:hypothetical protein
MGRRKAEAKRTRFTLWLPNDTLKEIDRLQVNLGKASRAEVLRDAFEVYASLLAARDDGVALHFEDSKTGERGRVWLLPGPVPTRR